MKKPTVTIAICACNEGANIGQLLSSIMEQKCEGFELKKILFISDGSTDKTVEIVKSFNSGKLDLRDYKKRMGKSYRLNEIYADVDSDFIVQPDADVILANEDVLWEIVRPMVEDEKVGITGGNSNPMEPETLLEKAVKTTSDAYKEMQISFHKGNNIYTATGRLIAMRKKAYKNLEVPRHTISNDHFVYFNCITRGFSYRYASGAKVYFRLPQTLKDHLSQETRFASAEKFMKLFYPPAVVDREYFVPPGLRTKAMFTEVIKHPFLSAAAFLLNRYCQFRAAFTKTGVNSLWEIVYSTKRLKK